MKNVILYGSGSEFSQILTLLDKAGYHPLCVADSKRAFVAEGFEVIPLEKIVEFDSDIIIITSAFFDRAYGVLRGLLGERFRQYKYMVAPYAWLMLVNVELNEQLLKSASKFMKTCKNELMKIYDCTDGETSRILNFIIDVRVNGEYTFSPYHEVAGLQYVDGYFKDGYLNDIGEFTFVDVGAYYGDTYKQIEEMYGESLCRYYAYEPSVNNFNKLKRFFKNVHRKIYKIENVALSDCNGTMNMGKSGCEFGIIDDKATANEEVRAVKLDDLNIQVSGKLVIKLDVEGAELSVLKGAINTITAYRPIMAICVYHRYNDIYDLPKFLLDNGLKYRFLLRAGIHTHMIAIP